MRMMKGLERKPYEEQQGALGLFSLEKERPHCSYNFLMRGRGGTGTDLFPVMTKPDRVQEVFAQYSQAHGVTLGDGPVQG
ncbi:hypothetical protein WISP_77323 [Willisornis vidua]|uniref:Uncharacterized protein n=1 Tax=Willisornis vidua TaxID=1566151 RepID=A0ABQ9D5L3_9PASS|nr:hypothetical protein WISP_77323 [Willisornis vidua]